MIKLHLMCGSNYIGGWHNVDLNNSVKTDQQCDLTQRFPWGTHTVDFIYSEHGIEHLNQQQGKFFLRECHRVLKVGGIVRIATPDMQYFTQKYLDSVEEDHKGRLYNAGEWKKQSWITEVPEGLALTNAAEMLNLCFYNAWGHQFMYDYECLKQYFQESGFNHYYKFDINQSYTPELQNLETRADSRLIVEGIK